jgi:hypothetical protein
MHEDGKEEALSSTAGIWVSISYSLKITSTSEQNIQVDKKRITG